MFQKLVFCKECCSLNPYNQNGIRFIYTIPFGFISMKNSFVRISLLAILGITSVASQAQSTGTITFTGELTDSTCKVDVDGQGADGIVNLPVISVNQLTTAGQTIGRTPFNMNLSECSIGAEGGHSKVSAFFQPGVTVDLATGRLKNTDTTGATNVDLQLLDVSGGYKKINVGNTDQINAMTYLEIDRSSGTVMLPYAVEYYANGQTTPGFVQSSVVYNLQYK